MNKDNIKVGTVILQAPRLKDLAEELADLLIKYGGKNFLLFDIATPAGIISVTLQPVNAIKTPATVIAEQQITIYDLRKKIKGLQRLLFLGLPTNPADFENSLKE